MNPFLVKQQLASAEGVRKSARDRAEREGRLDDVGFRGCAFVHREPEVLPPIVIHDSDSEEIKELKRREQAGRDRRRRGEIESLKIELAMEREIHDSVARLSRGR